MSAAVGAVALLVWSFFAACTGVLILSLPGPDVQADGEDQDGAERAVNAWLLLTWPFTLVDWMFERHELARVQEEDRR